MPFGTWNEIGLVIFLAVLIVGATKIGAIGSAIGGFFAEKKK
jgi:Sec-independent protein translocase protein TatA